MIPLHKKMSNNHSPQQLSEMKKLNHIFLLAAFCLGLTQTAAQITEKGTSPIVLSLAQCKAMALENNLTLQNSRDKIETSKLTSRYAFTKYFPNISAEGMAFRTNKGALQYSLDIPLGDLGQALGLGSNFSYDFQLIKKGSLAGVNLIQPLFMGGRILYGNKLAHVGEDVARLELTRTQQEVVMKVEEFYWKLATLNAKRGTVLELISMLDTLTTYVQSYVEAGITTRNDLLQVKLKRNQMSSNLVDLDNGINLVRMALSQSIGYSDSPGFDVESAPVDTSLPELPLEYYINPADAVSNTPDFGLLTQAVKASEIQEKLAVGDNLPVLAGGAGWFYEHILGQNHNFGAIYVTLAIPLTDWWGGSYNIKKRKIETRMARNSLENASQLLQINITNAWNDIVSARDKIGIAIESIGQSEENLRLNKAYYEAGLVNLTDLLEAQTLYKSSKDDYIEAYGNFRIKTLQYRQATGQE